MQSYSPFDIVRSPLEGMALIEAGAGTGKTYAIEHIYLRLLLEKSLGIQKLLVVTFTEAATKELKERIRALLVSAQQACTGRTEGEEALHSIVAAAVEASGAQEVALQLRKALVSSDEAAVFTIHGFCARMLGDHAFESALPFDLETISDQSQLVQEAADDYFRSAFGTGDELTAVVAQACGLTPDGLVRLARRLVPKPTLKFLPSESGPAAGDLRARYEKLRAAWRESAADAVSLLSTHPGLRRSKTTFRQDVLDGAAAAAGRFLSGSPAPEGLRALALFSDDMITESVKKNHAPPEHPLFKLCAEFLGTVDGFAAAVKRDFAKNIQRDLRTRKQAQCLQSFDDMLLGLRDALQGPNGSLLKQTVRRRFPAVLIDEFQDTDPVQYEIFTALFDCPGCSLFFVGDPKQSIYSFRGADIFSYLQAAATTHADRRYTLQENYRSESSVIEGVNFLFGESRDPFVLPDIAYRDAGAAPGSKGNAAPLRIEGHDPCSIVLWPVERSNKEEAAFEAARATVCETVRLLELARAGRARIGPRVVQPSDIAVLVTRNADAQMMHEKLSAAHVPSVLKKSGSVFHSTDAEDIELLLTAVAAPGSTRRLHAALVSPLVGVSAAALWRCCNEPGTSGEYDEHLERFSRYHSLWRSRGFMRMFRVFLSEYEIRRRLMALPSGERRLTNVLHLAELLNEAESAGLSMTGLLFWLAARRAGDEDVDEEELRLERDDDAVQILTVHKSKGLEYPIVFCPFLWRRDAAQQSGELFFHRDGSSFCHIGPGGPGEQDRLQAERESLSELVRLLYVAITRARNRCYLAWAKTGRASVSALDYLLSGGKDAGGVTLEGLRRQLKNFSAEKLRERLEERAPKTLSLDAAPSDEHSELPPAARTDDFRSARVFAGPIRTSWALASFSGLTAGEHHAAPAVHEPLKLDEPRTEPGAAGQGAGGFFSFPRGPVPGTCIHTIFEQLDFASSDSVERKNLVSAALKQYGLLDGQQRVIDVCDMIERVLAAPLLPGCPEMNLGILGRDSRLSELDFFYPLKRLSPDLIRNSIARHEQSWPMGAGVSARIGSLDFNPVEGYMRGFIDLVFCCSDRYYLLDWKTNYLGDSCDDYRAECLQQCMLEQHYILQYCIYTLAVHRYLQSRLQEYDYGRHFGGVVYLFVRGVTPEKPGNGIFFDLPPQALVEDLDRLCAAGP